MGLSSGKKKEDQDVLRQAVKVLSGEVILMSEEQMVLFQDLRDLAERRLAEVSK